MFGEGLSKKANNFLKPKTLKNKNEIYTLGTISDVDIMNNYKRTLNYQLIQHQANDSLFSPNKNF